MRAMSLVLGLAACVGQPGKMGKQGEDGPAGPPGEGLVWKDATGTILENAYPSPNHPYQLAIQSNGVLFEYTALGGRLALVEYDSTQLTHYYLTSNCTGEGYVLLVTAAGVALKYDNRIIALPNDMEVQVTMGSAWYSGSCHPAAYVADFTMIKAIEALPTQVPPPIAPGPYHLDKV